MPGRSAGACPPPPPRSPLGALPAALLLALATAACAPATPPGAPAPASTAGLSAQSVATAEALLSRGAALATPTPLPSAATGPEGWTAFREHGYAGVIRPDWHVGFVDAKALAQGDALHAALRSLPPEARDRLLAEAREQQQSRLVVLMEPAAATPASANNLNVSACEDPARVPPDGASLARYFRAIGLQASVAGTVIFGGRPTSVVQIAFSPGFDTYQTVLVDPVAGCAALATLTTRPGDRAPLDDFASFIAALSLPRQRG